MSSEPNATPCHTDALVRRRVAEYDQYLSISKCPSGVSPILQINSFDLLSVLRFPIAYTRFANLAMESKKYTKALNMYLATQMFKT